MKRSLRAKGRICTHNGRPACTASILTKMDAVRAWRPLSDIKMDAVRAWRPSFHNGRRACMTSILCCMRMDAVRAQRPLLHNGRHTRTASIPPDAKWTLCARGVHLYIMDGVHARCPFSPGPKWTLCAHTSIISKWTLCVTHSVHSHLTQNGRCACGASTFLLRQSTSRSFNVFATMLTSSSID